jgi:hypothetical protein
VSRVRVRRGLAEAMSLQASTAALSCHRAERRCLYNVARGGAVMLHAAWF